ncbi:unnamed protein product [Rotaria magnacalcarata]|uniref:Large ribosomal subunit protein eL28 n=1 Tax=Rotaria magnacalcarata TaxID=392030 RepID=A0A816YAQ5_9BILA|nr:unnamed protein product [Rotaria magnacalcarata]CAF1590588.1 unnamed protein product [Rotaria magnacalcarata]CAF2050699.1 unnamed protein product [Rotaria magnacalcarata]CAF2077771.1 unnamed protein product [Rotaria magnacalcarata]CAF2156875.1 unnamed protein product [Rotaria magnacalcarata]
MVRGRFDQASSHVQWMIIRNNSSFLQKRKLGTYTTEPNNLKNRNNFRYNGLIHPKIVGVEAVKDGKGVVLSTGSVKNVRKPSKRLHKVKLTKDSRRILTSIRRTIRKQCYRKDLKMAALRRASALLRGQRLALTTATTTKIATKRSGKNTTAATTTA